MSHEALLRVTDAIYATVGSELTWSELGGRLASLLGARSVSLMFTDSVAGSSEILSHAGIPVEAVAAYRQHYRHVDLWTTRAAVALRRANGALPVLASGELLVPDHEFLRSEFYNDFGRRHGLRYVVGTVLPLADGAMMPIGLHRPAGAERFGAAEKQLLEQLLPHLRRAIQLRRRLAPGPATDLGASALDAMAIGVVVVDAELGVLLANSAAERLSQGAGAALRIVQDRMSRTLTVRPCHRAERDTLRRLVRDVALSGLAGGALRLRDADGMQATAVMVSPLPARLAGGSELGRVAGRALLLLRSLDPPDPTVRPELLRSLFGLTRAEAEVARALSGGATKAVVAAARGLRETTVRTQVRSVLGKTNTRSLRELERLLAGLRDG